MNGVLPACVFASKLNGQRTSNCSENEILRLPAVCLCVCGADTCMESGNCALHSNALLQLHPQLHHRCAPSGLLLRHVRGKARTRRQTNAVRVLCCSGCGLSGHRLACREPGFPRREFHHPRRRRSSPQKPHDRFMVSFVPRSLVSGCDNAASQTAPCCAVSV